MAASLIGARRRLSNALLLPFLCRHGHLSLSNRAFASNNRNNGDEFENLFGKPTSSSSSEASGSGSDFWKSLMKEPSPSKDGGAKHWEFLKELDFSSTRQKSSPAQDTSRRSFRELGESSSRLDFLSDALERPFTPKETPKQQEPESELGEQGFFHSASFQLLRDSFQKVSQTQRETSSVKSLDDALGLDSGTLFSSQEQWSRSAESRSLSEVEGNFYSTSDAGATEDTKTYTYDELGSKLQLVRPVNGQILFSATGLSFGELRTRLQKIEELDQEGNDQVSQFKDLRESLNHLRSAKSLTAKKQLTYEELAFLNTFGTRSASPAIKYTPPNDLLLEKYYSEDKLSSKEQLRLQIKKLREEFQTHEHDSGSPQVQIAILTAWINNLNRHLREGPNYKRDKHSRKGLNDMVQYRKRLLRYLRRRDWPAYCNVLTKLNLDDIILSQRT